MKCLRCDAQMGEDVLSLTYRCPADPSHDLTFEELQDYSCQRCGDVGFDRRTLWMACLYAMEETGLPFERLRVRGFPQKIFSSLANPLVNEGVPQWADVSNKEEFYPFYLLRVCKGCRAEWVRAISEWFKTPRAENLDTDGNLVFNVAGER